MRVTWGPESPRGMDEFDSIPRPTVKYRECPTIRPFATGTAATRHSFLNKYRCGEILKRSFVELRLDTIRFSAGAGVHVRGANASLLRVR